MKKIILAAIGLAILNILSIGNTTRFSITILATALILIVTVIVKNNKNKNFKSKISKINITPEFEEMYSNLYTENANQLEALRKRARNRKIMQLVGFIIIFAGAVTKLWLLIIIGFIFVILGLNKTDENNYKSQYKTEIINNLIKIINERLEYNTKNFNPNIVLANYQEADFDNEVFNIFNVDDNISGFLEDDLYIEMSDLDIQKKEVYYDDEGDRHEHIVEIFKGIFAQTICNKDIGTYIKISKNEINIFGRRNKIEMDSAEFEKYFNIYSQDKILTMRILTSDVMVDLVDFYNKYNLPYEIVIRDNNIYMRFFTGAMFEPKIFGNALDKKQLFTYYCILKFIVNVTKDINKAVGDIEI